VAAELPPGSYELTATLQGFDSLLRQGITLTVGQDALVNLTMQVGSVQTQVTVTGEAPLVNTTSAGVSGVVEEKRITELPLNGRDFAQLALSQPGALNVRTAAAATASKGYGTRVSLSGSRPMDTGWTLDGTNINSVGNFATPGSAAGVVLGVDAIREFRVVTGGGYSAEYGGYSGGVVQMVTKSGTNEFHGTAFGLHRNDNFDANAWENKKGNKKKSEFRRNQFGGSIGGPIRRDKIFFFGAYEGLRQARSGEIRVERVPDGETRRGNAVATLAQCNGVGGSFNAGTGRCAVTIAPSVRPYVDIWPAGDGELLFGQNGAPTGVQNRYTPVNPVTDEDYWVTRGDYQINDNQKLFSRFTYDNGDDASPGPLGVYTSNNASRQRFATLQYENILSPTLLWSSTFSFNRNGLSPTIDLNIDYPKNLWFLTHPYPPAMSYTGVDTFSGADQPSFRIQNKWAISQAFSLSHGNHSFKFGGSWDKNGFNNNGPAAGAFGQFQWGSALNFLTDATLENLTAEVPGADTARTVRQQVYGFYFQDDWRVASNFSLNMGMRYEPWTSPGEKWGRVSTYRDYLHQTEFSNPKTDGTDTYFDSPGETTFSPRIGLAWDVNGDGKTAIRAGGGIFHLMLLTPYLNTVTRKNPPDAGTLIQNSPGVNLAGAGAYVLGRTAETLSTRLNPNTFSEAIQFDLKPMYEIKYNFTIERQLLSYLSLAVGYIGNRGTHLTLKSDGNAYPAQIASDGRAFVGPRLRTAPRPNPNNGVITYSTSDAKSFYDAMTVELKKRISHGFQFQAVYTWSKTIDDSSTGLGNSDFGEGLVSQPYNHRADRGLASTHTGRNLSFSALWALPSPVSSGVLSKILGGWNFSTILALSDGVPVFAGSRGAGGTAWAPDGRRSANNEQRPDLVAGRTVESLTNGTTAGCQGVAAGQKLGTPDLYFDPCAFTRPPSIPIPAGAVANQWFAGGYYGNSGRNIIIGPSFANLDISLKKSTPLGLGESSSFQFHADFFNLLNHPSFGRPQIATIQNSDGGIFPGAGTITSTASSSRQIQFGVKIIF
jgi:hypothetical protein